jgi:hypothetical protein
VFEFLSRQVMNLAALPRQSAYEGLLADVRRAADREAPRAPVARPAMAEDQVLLASRTAPPPPALPVKPADPAEPGQKIRDMFRRLRDQSRRSASRPAAEPDTPPDDDREHPEPAGQRFDRWA